MRKQQEKKKEGAAMLRLIQDTTGFITGYISKNIISILDSLFWAILLRAINFRNNRNKGIKKLFGILNGFNFGKKINKKLYEYLFLKGKTLKPETWKNKIKLKNKWDEIDYFDCLIFDIDSAVEKAYAPTKFFAESILNLKEKNYWIEKSKSGNLRLYVFMNGIKFKNNIHRKKIKKLVNSIYKISEIYFNAFGLKLDMHFADNPVNLIWQPGTVVINEKGEKMMGCFIERNQFNKSEKLSLIKIYSNILDNFRDKINLLILRKNNGKFDIFFSILKNKKSKLEKNIKKEFNKIVNEELKLNNEFLTKRAEIRIRKIKNFLFSFYNGENKKFNHEFATYNKSKLLILEKIISEFNVENYIREKLANTKFNSLNEIIVSVIKVLNEHKEIKDKFGKLVNVKYNNEINFEDIRKKSLETYIAKLSDMYNRERFKNVMLPAAAFAKALDLDFDIYDELIREYLPDKNNLDRDIEIAWRKATPLSIIDNNNIGIFKNLSSFIGSINNFVKTYEQIFNIILSELDKEFRTDVDKHEINKTEFMNRLAAEILNHKKDNKEIRWFIRKLSEYGIIEIKKIRYGMTDRSGIMRIVTREIIKKGSNFDTNIKTAILKYLGSKYEIIRNEDDVYSEIRELYSNDMKKYEWKDIEPDIQIDKVEVTYEYLKETLERAYEDIIGETNNELTKLIKENGKLLGIDYYFSKEHLWMVRKFWITTSTIFQYLMEELTEKGNVEFYIKQKDFYTELRGKFGYKKVISKNIVKSVLKGMEYNEYIAIRRAGRKGTKIIITEKFYNELAMDKNINEYGLIELLIRRLVPIVIYAMVYYYFKIKSAADIFFRDIKKEIFEINLNNITGQNNLTNTETGKLLINYYDKTIRKFLLFPHIKELIRKEFKQDEYVDMDISDLEII